MQFKYPEFLYFLLLLIIPIIVHLFQLRKFKKTPFTNVAFLKNLVIKNRKSSQLKKWLVLCTRLLMLAAAILAFAQPYFANKNNIESKDHVFVYLDNSLSTNTKSSKGNILKVAAQNLIETISETNTYSLLSNANFYQRISGSELKDLLKKISYTTTNISAEEILLKIESLKNTTENILISDFQSFSEDNFKDRKTNLSLVQIVPEKRTNLAIDSVYVDQTAAAGFKINAIIKNQGEAAKNIPLAIYNGNKLISKQTFEIEENQQKTVEFTVEKADTFLGKLVLNNADAYDFDNSFYFSINTNKKINVLSIGEPTDYLDRLFNNDEFNYITTTLLNTNYNGINEQQLIILNELKEFPTSLTTSIRDFVSKGGHLVIIPNKEINLTSYNAFLKNMSLGSIVSQKKDSLKITNINFNHPLFKNVFDKKVRNFQYPYTNNSYVTSFKSASNAITFENNTSFLQQVSAANANIYWFASPLNKENSNFTNSPLIVPVFYNIAQKSLQLTQLYYTVKKPNTIEINTSLKKDAILSIQNNEGSFIPLQQSFQNKVRLSTEDQPEKNGFYAILKEKDTIQKIAYNNPKTESSLQFLNVKSLSDQYNNIAVSNSVTNTIEKIDDKNKVRWLWKWFLIIAIVSLLAEILILKYFKV
ncbi:BatA domain-containing protein [Tenacibaculum sp. M341]|uniref:BatA domain-containing protein n=1 Tax=Tenacibaculum sp. M341 TaxID=2530339 RepID=UPI00104A09AC|nr:BatA domain-containing protein [Tenacibaculum sp. M341]TCI89994.1 hypothetical protein EYW44_15115 [Tenacibaculum sp. M341]